MRFYIHACSLLKTSISLISKNVLVDLTEGLTSTADRRIRVLVTGGTFDKEYDEINGQLYFKDSHLPEMLALGRCKLNLEIRTLMMVDSLEMTEADRSLIVEQCRATPGSR